MVRSLSFSLEFFIIGRIVKLRISFWISKVVHKNNQMIEINFISSSKQPVNKVQIIFMVFNQSSCLCIVPGPSSDTTLGSLPYYMMYHTRYYTRCYTWYKTRYYTRYFIIYYTKYYIRYYTRKNGYHIQKEQSLIQDIITDDSISLILQG